MKALISNFWSSPDNVSLCYHWHHEESHLCSQIKIVFINAYFIPLLDSNTNILLYMYQIYIKSKNCLCKIKFMVLQIFSVRRIYRGTIDGIEGENNSILKVPFLKLNIYNSLSLWVKRSSLNIYFCFIVLL